MKIIETRPAAEGICLMSWSPKMDLLAICTIEAKLFLHRLTWQKVWQVDLGTVATDISDIPQPSILTWHPEGISILVVIGSKATIIDTEAGKVVYTHELSSNIRSARWSSSEYEQSIDEILSLKSRHQSEHFRDDLRLNRLELYLSALILCTDDGLVSVYTGGFVLAFVLKMPNISDYQILHVEAAKDLQSYHALVQMNEEKGKLICYSNFRNDTFKEVCSTISSMGFKYLSMMKNWKLVQSELGSLSDQWGKFVDIHRIYLTFGSTDKDEAEIKADYTELLFTGISTVELEMFIGSIGREKEIKKHSNMAISIANSMTEHLRVAKCAIMSLLTEFNEISGFLLLSKTSGANEVIAKLRKSLNYIFISIVHVQQIICDGLDVFRHFLHLLLNTIHCMNNQDIQELGEEDCDVDKVLEFLNLQFHRNVFEFLLKNADEKFKPDPSCFVYTGHNPSTCSKTVLPPPASPPFPFLPDDDEEESAIDIIEEHVRTNLSSQPAKNIILDFEDNDVISLLGPEMASIVETLMMKLLEIPLLSTVCFIGSTYPVTTLPSESADSTGFTDIVFRHETNSLWAFISNTNPGSLLMFEFSFSDMKPVVKPHKLQFTASVCACKMFANNSIAIVIPVQDKEISSKQIGVEHEPTKSLVFVVNLDKIDVNGPPVDLYKLSKSPKSKTVTFPSEIPVDVSLLEARSNGLAESSYTFVESVMSIDNFCASMAAVSGSRKLGALLSQRKHLVALLDMEQESCDNSLDDEDGEDSILSEGV